MFNDTGIVAIQKGNSNNRVLLNSDGISISTNGGESFKTAIDAQGIVADQLYGKLIQGINFETRDDSNNFKIELMDGLVKFFDDSKIFGYLSSLNDSVGNAIGIEFKNNAGYTLNLGQTDSSGKSTPVFQITPNSTIESPKYKLFGQLLNNLKANVPSGWLISNTGKINFSTNDGINNNLEISENGSTVLGDSNVYNGSNNILQTSNDSLRAIPSYGLTENYIGDIGESKTGDDSEIEIQIEGVYAGLVSTSESYQVFITPYSQAKFWVEERSASKFVVKSDVPGAAFGWEIKAKRKGYEDSRLVQTNI
ncbi:hypothetical protein [Liquorilactobacillus mali]|uniref:hypothetical protein n=1 Tax=Liquorilactobacillus mali TaxID=1618 RepID=UPI002350B8D6|nr:hypothetical protein [Liquorilactobacillus mali]MDC7953607.1 hypothetical protein [Liquorilactobacillus mali]